jgi:phosphonate degradation associated HDIG domain protein
MLAPRRSRRHTWAQAREWATKETPKMRTLQSTVDEINQLFASRGDSQYGGEAVSQREHALQAALLAEQQGDSPAVIVAALLHDVGHLLHDLPNDAPDRGIDDLHEQLGYEWLAERFGADVCEPVRQHVAAKRYLCAVEPDYLDNLSEPSKISLALQGGPLRDDEVRAFEAQPHFRANVAVRRHDDRAKVAGLATPPVEYFAKYIEQVAC